jgi:NAD(P)-dependent dehydrogenase (short-subunit alcohol dehydrogenase family)
MDKRTYKILITGGTQGLGRTMAEHLCSQGHEVFNFSKTAEAEIDPSYLSLLAGHTQCDISNADNLEVAFRALINQIDRVDVLINNASIRQPNKLGEFETSEIQRNVGVDFIAPVILSNLCMPGMKRNNFGRIINISSISAYKVYRAGSLYCSDKRALIAFTESFAMELINLRGAVSVHAIIADSFSEMDGTKLKNHSRITNSVLASIDSIIQSETKRVLFHEFTFNHKLRESLRSIKKAIQIVM